MLLGIQREVDYVLTADSDILFMGAPSVLLQPVGTPGWWRRGAVRRFRWETLLSRAREDVDGKPEDLVQLLAKYKANGAYMP